MELPHTQLLRTAVAIGAEIETALDECKFAQEQLMNAANGSPAQEEAMKARMNADLRIQDLSLRFNVTTSLCELHQRAYELNKKGF